MDIVADSLSAGLLKTKNVTVNGRDVLEWFQSKLSVAVSFVGVFEDLEDAPERNGAVAIVGGKDYIYSEDAGEWQELGDEGRIGAISQAVSELSSSISEIHLSDFLTRNEAGSYVLSSDGTSSLVSAKVNVVTKQEYLQLSAGGKLISTEIYAVDGNLFDEGANITVQRFGSNGQIVTEQTDLSILCLSSMDQLADYVAKDKLADNAIYRVKSDYETTFGKRLTDVADPINAQDAVTLQYFQQNIGTMKFSEIQPITEDQYTYNAWLDDNTVNAIYFGAVGRSPNITFHVPSKQSVQNQPKMRNFVLYLESFDPMQQIISFIDDFDDGNKTTDFQYTSWSNKLSPEYSPQSGDYVLRFLEISRVGEYNSLFLIDCTKLTS